MSLYTIRFSDCDPFGHLNNGRYIDYFLNAREDHLRDHYGIELNEWAKRGIGFVVNRHDIRYLRPAGYNERVAIRSALIGWTDTELHVELQMWDEPLRQLKAIVWTSFTRVNAATGRKEAHTQETIEFVRWALLEGGPEGLDERIAALRTANA
ncbi:acyl-CoA thioester hydrolase [Dinghuibacter silviterrae]|uniref:Acyl-CoA thioester hydrolase n=2 Tax=Dinghuibacter silviterrae TaxID=1539049 RepID=A0A4R8DGK7_9BACT|nr:acyl-CoA thioester hydrolase [Dinghuibacter silviterrae]